MAAWAEPTLAVLGIFTLGGAIWVWRERWRIANLRVGRTPTSLGPTSC